MRRGRRTTAVVLGIIPSGLFFDLGNHVMALKMRTQLGGNPVKKIVTLLEDLKKEVEEEAAVAKKQFEKGQCSCRTTLPKLKTDIDEMNSQTGELQSIIDERLGSTEQLKTEIAQLAKDIADNSQSLKEAQAVRKKEASEYQAESYTAKTNIAGMDQAIPALRKGLAGSFLQTAKGGLQTLLQNQAFTSESDRELALAVMSGKTSSSGEIIGILEQMRDNMKQNLLESTQQEEEAVATFNKLEGSKKGEIEAAKKEKVEKEMRLAKQETEKATAEQDLADVQEALVDTQKELQDKAEECKQLEVAYETDEKARQQEILGIGEALEILTSDEAVMTFNKMGSKKEAANAPASFMQSSMHSRNKFAKLIQHCEKMIKTLKEEQVTENEEHKKCKADLQSNKSSLTDSQNEETSVKQGLEQKGVEIEAVDTEVAAVKSAIAQIDQAVKEDTENRAAEKAIFDASSQELTGAIGLLNKAAEKLKATYGVKAEESFVEEGIEEETDINGSDASSSTQDRETADMLGLSFVQLKSDQPSGRVQKGGGIVAILTNLIHDCELELNTLSTEEKAAIKAHEAFIADSAKAKKARKEELVTKTSTKAKLKSEKEGLAEDVAAASDEVEGFTKEEAALHQSCDFLLENFEDRKKMRVEEVEELKRAIAILMGMKDMPPAEEGGAGEEAEALIQKSGQLRSIMLKRTGGD